MVSKEFLASGLYGLSGSGDWEALRRCVSGALVSARIAARRLRS